MTSVFEMDAHEFNVKLAEALKQVPEFEVPEWVEFIKSGASKERPIDEPDFWYRRAASILRQIYKQGILGVNRLRTKYGSKKNRGYQTEEFRKASGKIIRVILQQTNAAGFTQMIKPIKGVRQRSGRKLTDKGKEFLESIKSEERKETKEKSEESGEEKIKEKVEEIKEENKKEVVEGIKEENVGVKE